MIGTHVTVLLLGVFEPSEQQDTVNTQPNNAQLNLSIVCGLSAARVMSFKFWYGNLCLKW